METLKCHLWSARRAEPLAELSQAERSEAQPREARPPPKAAGAVRRPGAEGDPRASRGLQTKARMRINSMRLSGWRIHSPGRRERVLCTNWIQWFGRRCALRPTNVVHSALATAQALQKQCSGMSPDAAPSKCIRNTSHSNICILKLARDARICINVSPYDRRRCDMQKRESLSPPPFKAT